MVVAQTLRRAPWWTTAMVTGAVAALVIPGIAEYLVYDRCSPIYWYLFPPRCL